MWQPPRAPTTRHQPRHRPIQRPLPIRVALARPLPPKAGYRYAGAVMLRWIQRTAARLRREALMEAQRLHAEIRREAGDMMERRRQHYEGERERERLLREEARAIMQRKTAARDSASVPRFRRFFRHDP